MLDLVLLAAFAATPPAASQEAAANPRSPILEGLWRVELASPGGALPFHLVIHEAGSSPVAEILNGRERVPVSSIRHVAGEVLFEVQPYGSVLRGRLSVRGDEMTGEWKKPVPGGWSLLPLRATRGDRRRFAPVEERADAPDAFDPAGAWRVRFEDADGSFPARAEFRLRGDAVFGTFLTETGDYRFLEGRVDADRMRLSCFDGGHAFLFDARMEGGAIEGDFWSRDVYHARWTAERMEPGERDGLPDPDAISRVTDPDGRFRFSHTDLDGAVVSDSDPRFAGRVVLVNLFGSWCPNCNDEAPLLEAWRRRYADRGLEVVGLAFEIDDAEGRATGALRAYRDRHGIGFPLLLAGIGDKADASRRLTAIDRVVAWPTTLFVGRDGRVRRVHTGFRGPGTGTHHERLKRSFEKTIEELLAEPPPGAAPPR